MTQYPVDQKALSRTGFNRIDYNRIDFNHIESRKPINMF